MSNDQKIIDIKDLCESILSQWGVTPSDNDDPYGNGQTVGRSVLAQTIMEIIDNG
jgi:hypothetical protein